MHLDWSGLVGNVEKRGDGQDHIRRRERSRRTVRGVMSGGVVEGTHSDNRGRPMWHEQEAPQPSGGGLRTTSRPMDFSGEDATIRPTFVLFVTCMGEMMKPTWNGSPFVMRGPIRRYY